MDTWNPLKAEKRGASSPMILLPPPTSQLTWAPLRNLTGKLNLTKLNTEIVGIVGLTIVGVFNEM
jgi:hypothetical protein